MSASLSMTERALIARINRQLRPQGEMIKTCRYEARGFNDLGRHFVHDFSRNLVLDTHVHLESMDAELRRCGRVTS
jgi:hypothetical protein